MWNPLRTYLMYTLWFGSVNKIMNSIQWERDLSVTHSIIMLFVKVYKICAEHKLNLSILFDFK